MKRFIVLLLILSFFIIQIHSVMAKVFTPIEKKSPEKLLKLADELMDTVSKLRGLVFKTQIKKELASQNKVKSLLTEDLNDPKILAKIDGEGKMYKKLGLIPEKFDYKNFLLELYTDQLAGMYDHKTKIIYIADWMDDSMQAPILVHELTHALQDQYLDLKTLLKPDYENSDLNISHTSVLEGEATLIMFEYMLKDTGFHLVDLPNFSMVQFETMIPGMSDSKIFNSAPNIIKKTMLFPYIYGMDFVMAFTKKYGWKKVDSIYKDMPSSSEQIMHPEKYITKRENPVKVKIPSVEYILGPEWKKINKDVLGEFFIKTMIGDFTTQGTGTIASQGWAGDEIEVFENNSKILMIMLTCWDSKKDGQEFFNAYSSLVEKRYNDESLIDKGQDYFLWSNQGSCIYLKIKDDRVMVIDGISEEMIYKLNKVIMN